MQPLQRARGAAAGRAIAATLVVLVSTGVAVDSAVNRRSTDSVKTLLTSMSGKQLQAIAVRHPAEPGRYVAARLYPGVQLLLISAKTDATAYMDAKLAERAYAEVYVALHQGIPESKLFIQDMGADGLRGGDGGLADIVYERGKDQHVLNGDHRAARMSSSEYSKLVADTDSRYAELLTILIEAAKAHQSAQ
jgi:hypothetical protein